MRESTVEGHLVEQCELHGALCEKHVAPGRRGVPDRLVTLKWGMMDLVETKAPDKKARTEQVRDHEARAERGVPVYLIDTKHKVDIYVRWRVINGAHYPALFSVPLANKPE